MRLAFLADARSAIAINWVRWFTEHGHEVHWISSRRTPPPLEGLASFRVLSLFPEFPAGITPPRNSKFLHPATTLLRHWLIPFRIGSRARLLDAMLRNIQPELLHAMRIPQEGMTAAASKRMTTGGKRIPLVVSVWGDDFTYHARSSPMMANLTRQTVTRTDALHSDCQRDIRLAQEWGLRIGAKTLVTPGNGGVRSSLFFRATPDDVLVKRFNLPRDAFFILNPRGIRGVARTDTFFKAIPIIIQKVPAAHFLALRMEGADIAKHWIQKLNLGSRVTLLPALVQEDMARLFRLAPITLSLTEHDGVPNVLLESMACGSFPICGDLESIREWIEPGKNGLLVSPGDADAVADAVVHASRDDALREEAAQRNQKIIAERAEWNSVMSRVKLFYDAAVMAG